MSGIIGFIVWCIFGSFFLVLAVCTWFAKKPMRFWANADVFEVSEIPKYNRAVSKLFGLFGILLIALGTPPAGGTELRMEPDPGFWDDACKHCGHGGLLFGDRKKIPEALTSFCTEKRFQF